MQISANQKGFTALEGLLIFVIVAIIGGTGYYIYHSNQQTDKNLQSASSSAKFSKSKVTNFEECKKAKDSAVTMTYPEQCTTKAGKSFTNTAAAVDEKPTIIAAAKVYMQERFKTEPSLNDMTYTYNVEKTEGQNAQVRMEASSADPQIFYVQKQNGTWKIVYFGHLAPQTTETCTKHNLPPAWCDLN